MSKKRNILRHYEPRIRRSRENYDVLDWASAASQQARFEVLVQNVDLDGRSLLDVGCGLGDLWAFLRARRIDVEYTGVDLSGKMIRAARRRQGGGRFIQADVFAEDNPFGPRSFDVVFCSGVFNLNLGNNRRFLTGAIGALMDLAREHVVFNLLHVRAEVQPDRYAYFDPADVAAAIAKHGWDIRVLDDYLPNDFTVIARRVESSAH